jgi:uncharacterized protein (TIGR02118 family)
MVAITVCYKSDRALDFAYYEGTHVPLVMDNLTPIGMRSAEIRKVLASGSSATPPYQLITSLYFEDAQTFERVSGDERWKAVVADIANFYPDTPDVMVTEVWR